MKAILKRSIFTHVGRFRSDGPREVTLPDVLFDSLPHDAVVTKPPAGRKVDAEGRPVPLVARKVPVEGDEK